MRQQKYSKYSPGQWPSDGAGVGPHLGLPPLSKTSRSLALEQAGWGDKRQSPQQKPPGQIVPGGRDSQARAQGEPPGR